MSVRRRGQADERPRRDGDDDQRGCARGDRPEGSRERRRRWVAGQWVDVSDDRRGREDRHDASDKAGEQRDHAELECERRDLGAPR